MDENTLARTLALDTYGEMLTEKQRRVLAFRYDQDLSLGEIGELEGISRQAVRDTILRAEAQLTELETKIGAVRRQRQLDAARQSLQAALQEAEHLGKAGEAVSRQIQKALERMEE